LTDLPELTVVEETEHFIIGVGRLPDLPTSLPVDVLPKYFVVRKEYGVVEYLTEVFYFASEWARQMEDALESLGKEKPSFPPPAFPNGQIN